MGLRNFYWVVVVVLSLGLLFEWTSEKRYQSIQNHVNEDWSSGFDMGGSNTYIENDELYVVIAVETGAIVETRLKKYPVEKVNDAVGFRVFGESKESAFSYYFNSGFTGVVPSYQLESGGAGENYVELVDQKLGLSKRISFCTSTKMYKSPFPAPLCPGSPSPEILILVPVSTPAGIVTEIVFCFLT